MKISEKIKKFQEGGQMPQDPAAQGGQPAPGGAPQDGGQGGQDPMVQLLQIAQQALEGKDCEAALAVCDGLIQLVQQAQGGGGAPAPADGSQGQPVFKAGGKFSKRI